MTITIFRSPSSGSVFIAHGIVGAWPFNCLKAIGQGDGTVSVKNLSKKHPIFTDFFEIESVAFAEFVDDLGVSYGASEVAVVNALNLVFDNAGGTAAPVITSSLVLGVTDGDTINYTVTADNNPVGYRYTGLPAGIVVNNANRALIQGVIAGGVGVYNVGINVGNGSGSDTETLVITVSAPPYSNTKAVRFNNSDFMTAAATTSNPFYRASNGTGAPDAWTMVTWFEGGTGTQEKQTIVSFGGSHKDDEGRVWLYWNGKNSDRRLVFRYGTDNDYLELQTPVDSFIKETYRQIIITYDGGTTGNSAGSLSSYFGRFEIWINGVSQTLTLDHNNNGFTDEIVDDFFLVGEKSSGGSHMRNDCLVDEMAIWNTDETANVAAIYNGGTTHDLALLASAPDHYWRFGDGDTFYFIQDAIASLDFAMNNMSSADIVNDVP